MACLRTPHSHPRRQVRFQDKLLYTLFTLLVFLVMSQIPLYGVAIKNSSDPFYWMRVIMASNRCVRCGTGAAPLAVTTPAPPLPSAAAPSWSWASRLLSPLA